MNPTQTRANSCSSPIYPQLPLGACQPGLCPLLRCEQELSSTRVESDTSVLTAADLYSSMALLPSKGAPLRTPALPVRSKQCLMPSLRTGCWFCTSAPRLRVLRVHWRPSLAGRCGWCQPRWRRCARCRGMSSVIARSMGMRAAATAAAAAGEAAAATAAAAAAAAAADGLRADRVVLALCSVMWLRSADDGAGTQSGDRCACLVLRSTY